MMTRLNAIFVLDGFGEKAVVAIPKLKEVSQEGPTGAAENLIKKIQPPA